jgi:acylphosphatase
LERILPLHPGDGIIPPLAARSSGRIARLRRWAARAMPDKPQVRRFYVSGRVHGVGFRFFTLDAAERLGLAGYVKNLRDGRVEVYAIGRAEDLAALRAALERGPRGAAVRAVVEEPALVEARYGSEFSVEHDSW